MKKVFICFIALIIVVAVSMSVLVDSGILFKGVFGNKIDNKKTIIVDAGHGGFDGGAVAGDGTPEKDINLSIAKNLKGFLELFGFNVIMTRESDVSTESNKEIKNKKLSDLQNRLKLMSENSDAIFVSIHLNKFTTSNVNGAQTFYSQKTEKSEMLAKNIHNNIIEKLQPNNEREIKKGTKNIYLLKNAECPAVIVECGFLSNNEDLKKLKDKNYQSMMAFCIFCGIMDYHQGLGM